MFEMTSIYSSVGLIDKVFFQVPPKIANILSTENMFWVSCTSASPSYSTLCASSLPTEIYVCARTAKYDELTWFYPRGLPIIRRWRSSL